MIRMQFVWQGQKEVVDNFPKKSTFLICFSIDGGQTFSFPADSLYGNL